MLLVSSVSYTGIAKGEAVHELVGVGQHNPKWSGQMLVLEPRCILGRSSQSWLDH